MTYVIFDVGNVIIEANHQITFEALKNLGVSPEKAVDFYTIPEYSEFSRGNITEEQFHMALIQHFGMDLSLDQVRQAHDSHIYALVDRIKDTLDYAKAHANIGFLTNTNIWQTAREKQFIDLELYGGPVLRSHELHLLKSDQGLFEKATEIIGASEEDIILVDDLTNNCLEARRYGWDFIQFKDARQTYDALIKKLN
ncbi:hypothetical protein H8D36_03475 [archaeon]|nr:hypothetical protein [archaeon]MBL7056846.1 hypothetical protein [Candidatus Woesearchaeota archaeon]